MSALLQTFVAQTNGVPTLPVHTYAPVILVTGREEMDNVKVNQNNEMRQSKLCLSNSLSSSDVNECTTANICGDNKHCTNTQGSYTCTCNSGFNQRRNGNCQGSYCSQLNVNANLCTIIYNIAINFLRDKISNSYNFSQIYF